MKWLEETHGTKFELVRHFLASMFDSEMFSARGQWRAVAVGGLALAIPSFMLVLDSPMDHISVIPTLENLRAAAIASQLAMLTMVLAVTGILALLSWQSLFPNKLDYTALAGLPVRPRQVFAARFLSMALLGGAITGAMSLLPSLKAPHEAVSCLVSSGLGCLFIFFGVVALQGILMNLLPASLAARVATYVQGALISVLFFAGLCSSVVVDWRQLAAARLRDFGAWAPPVWFAGLERWLTGDRDPFLAAMAARGVEAVALAVGLTLFTYVLAYRRYRSLLLEGMEGPTRRRAWRWSPLRLLARDPRREAILRFLAAVVLRSGMHRLTVLAYAGAGLGFLMTCAVLAGIATKWHGGWNSSVRFVCTFWPVGMSLVLLAGIRHAFAMPAELRANWLFQITENQGRREWMSAVERFVIAFVIAPVHLVILPVAAASYGWPIAVRMTVLQTVVSLTAFELIFNDWQQLPFACSYVPGKRLLAGQLAVWIGVMVIVLPAVAKVIAALSQLLGVFLFYVIPFGALWIWTRGRRREGWGEARLIYEDRHNELPDLGIRDMSYAWAEQAPAVPVASECRADEPVQAAPMAAPAAAPAAALRAHRAIASGLPQEFKNVYGDELDRVAEEVLEPTWRSHGVMGLGRMLLDIAIRIPVEYLAEFRQDVRYALRVLAASPGFTAVALVSLTLGIGVATAAFSEMNGFVLRDVPGVHEPAALVMPAGPVSYPDYRRYRERTDLFSATLAYMAPVPFGISIGGRTERIWGHLVTPSYFSTLGVRPILGRIFNPDDERRGQTPVVVVSFSFWREHLGGDPAVIGTRLRINGQPCTVVGVGPPDFQGASPMVYNADLWLPVAAGEGLAPEMANHPLEDRDQHIFHLVARLQPGVAPSRAEAALDTLARGIEQEYGDADRNREGRRVLLLPAGKLLPFRKQDLPYLTGFFLVLGGMILLIASSNTANMMLARAADRRKEIAIRLAMGAGRGRLVRQLLTESMLIAAAAGVLGFVLASFLMSLASRDKLPYPMPLTIHLEPDTRVLLFTLCLTVFTGFAFGLLPALRATRTDLTPALKESGTVLLSRYRRLNLRNVLVLSQVAGSLALLLITGALVLGHRRIAQPDVGFDPQRLSLISLDPIRDGYSGGQAAAFLPRLMDRLRGVPTVASASLSDSTPMEMIGQPSVPFSTAGAAGGDAKVLHSARQRLVGKEYFDTLGIPIMLGRNFREQDERDGSTAVIVSEKLVRVCWKGEDPLGRRIEIGEEELPSFQVPGGPPGGRGPHIPKRARRLEVVGVAKDVRDGLVAVAADAPALIYLPLRPADYARPGLHGLTLMIRSAPGVDGIGLVRREVAAMDEKLTPFDPRSMLQQIEAMMFPVRAALWTYGCIGLFGLILASVGLAGVTAYSVTRRRREIGIRVALGARHADVLGLVMKESGALVAVGSAIGLVCAVAGIRLLSAVLYTVSRTAGTSMYDPMLVVGAPALLGALAIVACYIPARKSTRIDPVTALRQE